MLKQTEYVVPPEVAGKPHFIGYQHLTMPIVRKVPSIEEGVWEECFPEFEHPLPEGVELAKVTGYLPAESHKYFGGEDIDYPIPERDFEIAGISDIELDNKVLSKRRDTV